MTVDVVLTIAFVRSCLHVVVLTCERNGGYGGGVVVANTMAMEGRHLYSQEASRTFYGFGSRRKSGR